MLERRRQRLWERQVERKANQRLRHTCRELDQLIDNLLPAARHQPSGNPAASSSGVEATTSRFRTFLQSARQLALFDSLTQLPNRHYFIERLHAVAAQLQQAQRHFAVLFIDIDKFKIINDSFGHATGDAVLLTVCQRLGALGRHKDFLARYGGDELAMILDLSHLHDQSPAALSAAARVRATEMTDAMREPVVLDDLSIPVSLSIGITLVDPGEQNLAGVMQRSDLAMYQAKRNRANRIVGPEDVVQFPQLSSYQLFIDLMDAIENQQLQVFFQSIRDTAGGQTGVEALARWQHPERGWVEPSVFLEIAEQYRQMHLLGAELIRLSLDGFRQLQEADPELRLFLNLAPSQLADPRLASNLLDAIRSRQLQGQQIVLELTENTLLEPLPPVVRNLELLRGAGISLALDDFGTGYSSLVMLKSLSPDIVKIDKAFIQAMRSDDRALHIISLIAELAPRLGMELVAEGIEDQATLQQLMPLGIHCFQGHELGRPSPLMDLLEATPTPQPAASKRSIV
ncbi:MAG: putative bifunctional diguanylate cyclase/phosphodiesterase [Vulcanococcus sp.]